MSRVAQPKVRKADINRAADLLRSLGLKVASVEIMPDKVKITTTEGRDLTLSNDDAELDAGIREHLAGNGHG